MYLILSCFEVFFRNIINNLLIQYDKNWITNINNLHKQISKDFTNYQNKSKTKTNKDINDFFNKQENLIKIAEQELLIKNKETTNNYLISQLSFGFWENLLSKNYENFIWNKYLKHTFKVSRGFLQQEINFLRKLRNRIAHNEHILNYNIKDCKTKIYNILDLVDINLKDFMDDMS